MNILPFLVTGLGIGAVYALAAVGLVLLYRTSGILNLALGATGALGAFVTFEVNARSGSLALGVLCGIVVSTVASAAYGRFAAPMLAYRDPVTRSMGTLGFALVLLGGMGVVWGEVPRRIQFPSDTMFLTLFGVRLTGTRMVALGLAVATVLALSVIIARTRLGLKMRALASDRHLSAILGVAVRRVELSAWAMIGVFSGISGILMANLVGLKASALTFLVVPAVAAAILGGMASLPAAAVAGIALGIVEAVLSAFPAVAPYRSASPYLLALVGIALMPTIGQLATLLRKRF